MTNFRIVKGFARSFPNFPNSGCVVQSDIEMFSHVGDLTRVGERAMPYSWDEKIK